MIYIKNISGDDFTIRGSVIADDAYLLIADSDAPEWYSDDSVLGAICDEDAQIASSNDGAGDISSKTAQWLYLSGDRVQHTVTNLAEGGLKKSDRGMTFTAIARETTTADYLITEDLQIKGGVLYSEDAHIFDSVSMEIVDTAFTYAGDWYPATPTEAGIPGVSGYTWAQIVPTGVSLHHYLKNFPVNPEGKSNIKNDAITDTPLNGLTIRITYHSEGDTDVKCNVGVVAYS